MARLLPGCAGFGNLIVEKGGIALATVPPPPDFLIHGKPHGLCYGSTGCIWPTSQKLNTPNIEPHLMPLGDKIM